MPIEFDKTTRAELLTSIQRFFAEQMDEEIGDLKAGRVLDYCLAEIAPTVYNQAIADAQAWLQDRAAELGDVRYQAEFGYWKR